MEIFVESMETGEKFVVSITFDSKLSDVIEDVAYQGGFETDLLELLFEGKEVSKQIGNDPLVKIGISGGECLQLAMSRKALALKKLRELGFSGSRKSYDEDFVSIVRSNNGSAWMNELFDLMSEAGAYVQNSYPVLKTCLALSDASCFKRIVEDFGGNPNCIGDNETLFHSCARSRGARVRMLYENGGYMPATSYTEHPVIIATNYRNFEFLNASIGQTNFDVPRERSSGKTSLHLAIYLRNVELVRTAIAGGCSLLTQDYEGRNAVHHSMSSCLDVLRVLVKDINFKKAVNAKDNNGRTPKYMLRTLLQSEYNSSHILKFLDNEVGFAGCPADSSKNTVLHYHALHDTVEESHTYSDDDYRAFNLKGDTPLLTAVRHKNKNAAASLLGMHPSSIRDKNKQTGKTALMLTAANLDVGVMTLLIQWGADAYELDKTGKSAMEGQNGHIVRQILSARNKKDLSPRAVCEKQLSRRKLKPTISPIPVISYVMFAFVAIFWFSMLLFPDFVGSLIQYLYQQASDTEIADAAGIKYDQLSNYTSVMAERFTDEFSHLNRSYIQYAEPRLSMFRAWALQVPVLRLLF